MKSKEGVSQLVEGSLEHDVERMKAPVDKLKKLLDSSDEGIGLSTWQQMTGRAMNELKDLLIELTDENRK